MNILAIGAHPDDIEISCAGTLAKLVQAGHNVVICHVSDGDKGHYEVPAEELIRIRKQEAQQSGAIIGCKVISLGMRDGKILADNEENRTRFIDLICLVQPDMVITHAPNDYMPDHVAVNRLVFDTTFLATLPEASKHHPIASKVPSLFYMDNLSGIDFQPTMYVDITDTFPTKAEMLKQHESQLVWLKEHDNVDVLDLMETLSKFRGVQAGCKYAEGFIQHMAWTRPNAVRFPV
ncbi:PIG-L deacetylase family protein [Paenibacillus eucommiae]|uniref:LmbE family N-acetylglucosaminyl deacetylase n=1 Tax=Paenibacillus eucommiae TaxID=1355755 RepID=A0ABS4IM17_9BACL|nr:PIG-L family deacetylase [Paenibacillus eucommiae]MBP1988617.1 LmbE family N-acetylglucosaminyl deacetylase [Paenibacillus eucommiae]